MDSSSSGNDKRLSAVGAKVGGGSGSSGTAAKAANVITLQAAVILFYTPSCAYSRALRPVFNCLPSFFNDSVRFLELDYVNATFASVAAGGFSGMPMLHLSTRDARMTYNGGRTLLEIVDFIANITVRLG